MLGNRSLDSRFWLSTRTDLSVSYPYEHNALRRGRYADADRGTHPFMRALSDQLWGRWRSRLLGQAFTDAVMESLGEAVYAVDEDGRLLSLNPAGEQLLGWKARELLGRDFHAVVHRHGADEPCPCRAVTAGGDVKHRDVDRFVTKAGREISVAWTATDVGALSHPQAAVDRGRAPQ